jgi:hypothetical protein|tara:strand:+ start:550 stop:801 length:252 start_codon:yes stop_codon:yes gene_type:complete
MGNSPVDRNANYMRDMWGTTKLVTDYYQNEKMTSEHDFLDNLANHQHQKMLREISNDNLTPKKYDTVNQEDLYEKIDENTELF